MKYEYGHGDIKVNWMAAKLASKGTSPLETVWVAVREHVCLLVSWPEAPPSSVTSWEFLNIRIELEIFRAGPSFIFITLTRSAGVRSRKALASICCQ